MSTEYTRTEMLKRERLIVAGIGLITQLVEQLDRVPNLMLHDLFLMNDAIRYLQLVAEEVPILKDEIGVL